MTQQNEVDYGPADHQAIKQFTPRILIIEGCDKTGKSTLSKTLVSAMHGKYLHLGKPNAQQQLDVYNWHKDHVPKSIIPKAGEGVLILDRYHISNIVYGFLFDKKSRLKPEEFNQLEDFLIKHDAAIVYCHRELDDLADDWHEEQMYQFKQASRILQAYEVALRQTRLPVFRYNFDTEKFSLFNLGALCLSASIME